MLVNNAGAEVASAFEQTTAAEVQDLVRPNLVAPIELTRLLLDGMLARGRGHVVFVGSISGFAGTAFQAVYAATKGGLLAFVRSARLEYADRPVGFSLVAPGPVADEGMFARAIKEGASTPAGVRLARPQRVGKAVVRAVRRDAPVLLVAGGPIRPLLALGDLAPGLSERATLRLGVREMFERPARARDRA